MMGADMIKPTLAEKAPEDLRSLRYPLLASPKIDGVRALVVDGVVYSRSGKPIPNIAVQQLFGHLHGADGELVVGPLTAPDVFRKTQAGVMKRNGIPDVAYYVFDRWDRSGGYLQVLSLGRRLTYGSDHTALLPFTGVGNADEVLKCEQDVLAKGFEGIMLRNPDAPYINGRTNNLLKLKRFAEGEAVVLGMVEQTSIEGRPMGTMGALTVRDVQSGVEFSVGTGFGDWDRDRLWALRDSPAALPPLRYRFFPQGGYDRPRFPVFAGFRNALDTSA
jgi:DNA ligase-1